MSNSKNFLLIFDFDGTIIDKDSEDELLKSIFPKEEFDKIMKKLDNLDFFEGFNFYYKRMKELGISLKDMNQKLEKIELSPRIEELFDYLRKNKSYYKIIICSSAIDYSINNILKYYGVLDLFDEIICTKGYIEEDSSEKLINVPKNQFPHNCNLCSPSLCKSNEIKKYLAKNRNKFKKILYVGDGSNDFCPSKNILKNGDIVFPRYDKTLYKMIFEEKIEKEKLICEIVPWKTANEIVLKLKEL